MDNDKMNNKEFDEKLEKILREDNTPEIDDNARKIAVNLAMAEFKNAQNEKESQKKSNNFQGSSFLSRLMGRSTKNGRENTMENETQNKSKKRFGLKGMSAMTAIVVVSVLSLGQLQETVQRYEKTQNANTPPVYRGGGGGGNNFGSIAMNINTSKSSSNRLPSFSDVADALVGKKEEPPKAPTLNAVEFGVKNKNSGNDEEVDPVYIEAVERENQADLERAQRQAGSAIPVPTGSPEARLEVPAVPNQTQADDPLHRWRALQEERISRELSDDSVGAQTAAKPTIPPSYKDAIERENQKNLDQAQREAGTTIPVPTGSPETRLEVPEIEAEDPLHKWRALQKLRIQEELAAQGKFEKFEPNSFQQVASNPVSTFSSDVDTASYAFVRKTINNGRLPHPSQVRTEEMVNYFTYNYPVPASRAEPFKPTVTVMDSPWAEGRKLMHIGIKGYEVEKGALNSNLVFLLDVSGSMSSADKLPLVKSSMRLLLDTLSPSDTISIVTYAGSTGVVLEPTPVSQKNKILNALENLRAGGGTAGAAGIELAYQKAEQNFKENAVNRVILATDGDFNVGITDREELKRYIERKREKGIFLSILGFGTGNYNDHLMQTLAQNGNGTANYIDSLKEAQKVLVHEATSALFPIAKDVKFQVEFNPNAVAEYRLIGYETRSLKREDFNNDKIDAGDIGAGHSVTAIYEFVPVGSDAVTMDPLRYGNKDDVAKPTGDASEYAFMKIRYKLPMENTSKLITKPVPVKKAFGNPNADVRFSVAVSAFAQIMQGGQYTGQYSLDDIIALAQSGKGTDPYGYRSEFISMVRLAKSLQR